jgi:nucleotidyltransferase/DNA polymerase involved in DNA repair
MPRTIAHIDMNAFFASVEQMCNPALRGKPLIICGDPKGRGVVSTASYEARKFGIDSGMSAAEAKRLCPDGFFLEGSPKKYVYYSLQILKTYIKFTSRVEPFSIDEAYLDFAGTEYDGMDSAERTGKVIKREMKNAFPLLTASIGFGPNRYIAKMASSLEKPDGLVIIKDRVSFRNLFWPRPVQSLWGVGEKTKEHLNKIGIFTVRDLACSRENVLRGHMGENGEGLHSIAWGRDNTPVISYDEGIDAKSMGHESTFRTDIDDPDKLEGILLRLCDQVGRRLRRHKCKARTICVKLRFEDFKTITRQKSINRYIDDDLEIFRVARALFRANHRGKRMRLIGVSASGLEYSGADPCTMFSELSREKCLAGAVDSVRDKYGENVLVRAGIIGRSSSRSGSNPYPAFRWRGERERG